MQDPARTLPDELASPYASRPWLAAYPPGVPADFEFPDVPLTRLLDDAAASFPTRVALAFLGTTLTYRELKDVADHLAAGLAGLGVRRGDRVALVLPNCPQYVLTVFAVLRLGAVVVPHDPASPEPELHAQLTDCGATVVVCLDRVHAAVARARSGTAVQQVVVTSLADYLPGRTRLRLRLPLPSARRARAELSTPVPKGADAVPFVRLLKSVPARQTPVDPQDLALLQYTGGTTESPRGVMLTHRNLVSNAYMNRLWDTGGTAGAEVTIAVVPLFHVYGLTVCLNATVLLAGTLVLLPRFDVDRLLEAVDRWRPTLLPGVPPVFRALADSPRGARHDLSSLRVCVSGVQRLPVDVQHRFERLSGARLVEGYGLTEASPSTHCNPVSDRRRPGSIGLPLPGTRCRIVDPTDCCREVPVGTPGELLVSGPQVSTGYWDSRDEPDRVLTDDGPLLTGDIAVMDEDGFFTLVDRKEDLIVIGGRTVYPSVVERVLSQVTGVQEAAVVGQPDRCRGQVVHAVVVRTPGSGVTERDVLEHCARRLAGHEVPREVEFRDEVPRTAAGKVLRRRLREHGQTCGDEPEAGRASVRKSAPPDRRSPLT